MLSAVLCLHFGCGGDTDKVEEEVKRNNQSKSFQSYFSYSYLHKFSVLMYCEQRYFCFIGL